MGEIDCPSHLAVMPVAEIPRQRERRRDELAKYSQLFRKTELTFCVGPPTKYDSEALT